LLLGKRVEEAVRKGEIRSGRVDGVEAGEVDDGGDVGGVEDEGFEEGRDGEGWGVSGVVVEAELERKKERKGSGGRKGSGR
jgi:hypothetical protein